jgi:hypothetical protein
MTTVGEIKIGKFLILKFENGDVWIENDLGEGMQLKENDFASWLEEFWEESF